MAWPERTSRGMSRAWDIDHIYTKSIKCDESTELNYPGQEWLMGFALPPFQRPVVWDEDRMARFVESAILGIHLGHFVYNNTMNEPLVKIDGKEVFHRTNRWLIDGQQRLTSFDRYFKDAFPVFGLLWSEVGERDRRRLLRTPFEGEEVSHTNEADLRQLYDLLNFGGVAHTEDQRATIDDEDKPSYPSP